MIRINGRPLQAGNLPAYPAGSVQKQVLLKMEAGEFSYDSVRTLKFELDLRAQTVAASHRLFESGLDFAIFRESRCNEEYWERTGEGGFQLKRGANPAKAILDIFANGSRYATECATAMVIVYYGALLAQWGENTFSAAFPKIDLMNWRRLDPLLVEVGLLRKEPAYFPGDRRYFANPDVNPLTPEWQGENVIDIGGGLYYGHGIGIHRADEIIAALNKNRSHDADDEARLLDSAGRPDFKKLASIGSIS